MLSEKKKKRFFLGVLVLISGVVPVTAAFCATGGTDTLSGYLEQALVGNNWEFCPNCKEPLHCGASGKPIAA